MPSNNPKVKDSNQIKLIKTLLLITAIVILAVVLARTLSGSETLAEYAEKQNKVTSVSTSEEP